MNFFKNGLRIWIALSSVAGFLGGWALLAHAPKPTQAAAQAPVQVDEAPLPTLAPIPGLRQGSNSSLQQFQVIPQSNRFGSRLRTGGS